MADKYGALELPVPTTGTSVGDPLLDHLGGYIQAAVNAQCGAAWATLRPRPPGEAQPVRAVFTDDPASTKFNEKLLPALFIWRLKGTFATVGDHRDDDVGRVKAQWVYPADPREKQTRREPFVNAVAKAVRVALEQGRIAEWAAPGDTSPYATAIAADVDAIKAAFATSTSAQTYSGAALDGVVGAAEMNPRREVTITSANVGGSVYRTDQDIVVTAINWYGLTVTFPVRFSLPGGGETLRIDEDVKQVVSVALPAMLTTGGSIQVGTSAVEARGSSLIEHAGMLRLPELVEWEPEVVSLAILDSEDRVVKQLRYQALTMMIQVEEELSIDVTKFQRHDQVGHGVDQDVLREGRSVSRGVFPDNGIA